MKTITFLVTTFLTIISQEVSYVEFDKELIGVWFVPYVNECGNSSKIQSQTSRGIEEITMMLKVISTKFSHVVTDGVGASEVQYMTNYTYYHNSSMKARIAEAAAQINRKLNLKTLTVTVGFRNQHRDNLDAETEMQVALESIQHANSIFPGTVEGILLLNVGFLKSTLHWIRKIRKISPHLKIGTQQFACSDFANKRQKGDKDEIWSLRKDIIRETDFILCRFLPKERHGSRGATYAFNKLKSKILETRSGIQEINRNIVVMGSTQWPSDGDKDWINIHNMRNYWIEVNKFAVENNYMFYMNEAFDNPCSEIDSKFSSNLGWWKLSKDELANNVSGYKEKISAEDLFSTTESEGNTSTSEKNERAIWVHIGTGVIAASMVLIVLFMLLLIIGRKCKFP